MTPHPASHTPQDRSTTRCKGRKSIKKSLKAKYPNSNLKSSRRSDEEKGVADKFEKRKTLKRCSPMTKSIHSSPLDNEQGDSQVSEPPHPTMVRQSDIGVGLKNHKRKSRKKPIHCEYTNDILTNCARKLEVRLVDFRLHGLKSTVGEGRTDGKLSSPVVKLSQRRSRGNCLSSCAISRYIEHKECESFQDILINEAKRLKFEVQDFFLDDEYQNIKLKKTRVRQSPGKYSESQSSPLLSFCSDERGLLNGTSKGPSSPVAPNEGDSSEREQNQPRTHYGFVEESSDSCTIMPVIHVCCDSSSDQNDLSIQENGIHHVCCDSSSDQNDLSIQENGIHHVCCDSSSDQNDLSIQENGIQSSKPEPPVANISKNYEGRESCSKLVHSDRTKLIDELVFDEEFEVNNNEAPRTRVGKMVMSPSPPAPVDPYGILFDEEFETSLNSKSKVQLSGKRCFQAALPQEVRVTALGLIKELGDSDEPPLNTDMDPMVKEPLVNKGSPEICLNQRTPVEPDVIIDLCSSDSEIEVELCSSDSEIEEGPQKSLPCTQKNRSYDNSGRLTMPEFRLSELILSRQSMKFIERVTKNRVKTPNTAPKKSTPPGKERSKRCRGKRVS